MNRTTQKPKNTGNELMENREYLQTILECTADGILVVNELEKVAYFNGKFAQMWHIPPGLLESKEDQSLVDFVLPQLKEPEAFTTRIRTLYGTTDSSFDVIPFKDGRVFERYSTPMVKDGKVKGRVWSFRDITERKKDEEELEQHRRHLEELVAQRTAALEAANRDLHREIAERKKTVKNLRFEVTQREQAEEQLKILVKDLERINTELEDFAYIVSHDLKAPLRGISSLTRWLVEDYSGKLDEKGHQYLDKLLARTLRMYNLIDGILQYSRVGRFKPYNQALDSRAVVDDVIETLSLPETVTVEIPGPMPTVTYDKTLLVQLFQNLISNAARHMGKPEGVVTVSSKEYDGEWEFCVRDNGVGIEEKHFERIFKMFQGLAPKPGTESTGIGLALVKKIAERSGGAVRVESEVGKGSAFIFSIPKKIASAPHRYGSTVLVIDDNAAFIKVAKTLLELEGHRVLVAANGKEALKVVTGHPGNIHFALMDILIPGEDAMRRYASLRELKPGMKIIACTGTDLTGVMENLRNAGVDGVVRKPFTVDELNDILSKAAKKGKMNESSQKDTKTLKHKGI